MKKIELTLCTGCKFYRDLIMTPLSTRKNCSSVLYVCTHPKMVETCVPSFTWKVYAEDRYVPFVVVAISPEQPIVPEDVCPLMEKAS